MKWKDGIERTGLIRAYEAMKAARLTVQESYDFAINQSHRKQIAKVMNKMDKSIKWMEKELEYTKSVVM